MPVEFYIHSQPQYSHELEALVELAQLMRHAFAASEQTYVLATNVHVWNIQADALVFAPHAIVLIEMKSCADPVRGDINGPWQTVPSGATIHGGSHMNPYHQVVAARRSLIKYLDRNRRRFLDSARAQETAKRWGHVSAAIAFSPFLHPDSKITQPSASRAWLRVLGLNEVANFLFSRVWPQIDLQPEEMRRLAETTGCKHWMEIDRLLPPVVSYGHLWMLDQTGNRAYAFPVVDAATIGRSRNRSLVVPRQFEGTSRHHAYLRVVGDTVWIYNDDEHSRHETFVNDESVPSGKGRPLYDGVRISLGILGHPNVCRLQFDRRLRREDADTTTVPTSATNA
jgi:hypothetical protein